MERDPESLNPRFRLVNQFSRAARDPIARAAAFGAGVATSRYFVGGPITPPSSGRSSKRYRNSSSSPSSRTRQRLASMPMRRRYRRRGSRRTFRRRKSYRGSIATEQRDAPLKYRYKRMPRGKRLAWKSFTKKFTSALLRQQPLQSYVNSDYQHVKSSTLVANQTAVDNLPAIFGCCLYAVNTGPAVTTGAGPGFTSRYSETDDGEIRAIFTKAYPTAVTFDALKLCFTSACMDVYIKNTDTVDMVFLDVYTVALRVDDNNNTQIRTQFLANITQQTSTGLAVAWPNLAITPFQNPQFCKRWKIESKRTIVIQPNDTVSLQMRDPRTRWVHGKLLESMFGYMQRVTRGYLFIARGVPVVTGAVGSGSSKAVTLTASISKTYQYYKPAAADLTDSIID